MNPYEPPTAPDPTSGEILNSRVKETLRKWNKLRIIYNLVLFVVGMLVATPSLMDFPDLILGIIIYAILANICFCAGPFLDVYFLVFSDTKTSLLRNTLFTFGLLGSILLTLIFGLSTRF